MYAKHKFIRVILVLGGILLGVALLGFDQVNAQTQINAQTQNELSFTSYREVSYGDSDNPKHVLDLYVPKASASQPRLLVFIHGGSWVQGSKSQMPEILIQELAGKQGFAVASINYRLVKDGKDRYPAQLEDVQRAIEFLVEQADGYGYRGDELTLMGGSAGAHLAMLYTYGFDQKNRVKSVINLFGPTDLSDKEARPDGSEADQIITNFLGTSDHLAPIAVSASPIYYLHAESAVPTLTFHGQADSLVIVSQATKLHQRLDNLGIPSQLVLYPGEGHGFSMMVMMDVFQKIISWLQTH